MSAKKKAAIVIIVCVIIGSVGVYLGLAYPFPVRTHPVSLSGIASTDLPVYVGWPNAQIQVMFDFTTVIGIWGYEVYDGSNTMIYNGIFLTSASLNTPWLDAVGPCTVTVYCGGTLEGSVTILARGVPFITP
jgi:hypothetical protein